MGTSWSWGVRRMRVGMLAMAAVLAAASSPAGADAVDDAARRFLSAQHVPGLSVAVVRDGKVTKARGYGVANLEMGSPASKETVYEIGSMTKQFTAAAIMLLVEDGRVKLTDSVTQYVSSLPEAWSAVTVRQLLDHTSGIKSYTGVTDFIALARTDHTADAILKLASAHPVEFAPGEKWAYNNTGYYLAGMVVEKASGKRYWDFLRERIFQPLGMTDTRDSDPSQVIARRASGYAWVAGAYRKRDAITPTAAYSAGGLVSTVLDMAKWDAALYSDRILKQSSRDAMWTKARLKAGSTTDYGLGWSVADTRGHRNVAHGGGTAAFSTYIARYPEDRLTVIVLTNRSGADAGGLARRIARIYLPDLAEPAIADNDPAATARDRRLLLETVEGRLDRSLLTPELSDRITPELLSASQAALKGLENLRNLEILARTSDGKERTVRYRARFRKGDAVLLIRRNAEGKIAGMTVTPD